MKIFFPHITKTGGQTIEYHLKKHFKTFTFEHDRDYIELPPGYDAYVGQSAYYNIDVIPDDEDIFSFTFLRDPVDRLISFYRYYQMKGIKKVQYIGREETFTAPVDSTLPLGEFLNQRGIWKVAYNRMARDLGCRHHIFENNFDSIVPRALDVLENEMSFVGIFEHFQESVWKLFDLLDIKEKKIAHRNKNIEIPDVDDISPEEYKIVNFFVRYDKIVYNQAKKIYRRMMNAS